MQMLKASIPTFSLCIGFATGLEPYDRALLLSVLGIAGGVVVASTGETEFDSLGFGIAILGLGTEAARLVLTQKLLQGEVRRGRGRIRELCARGRVGCAGSGYYGGWRVRCLVGCSLFMILH